MMKKLTRSETAQFLLTHDNYRILTHVRPDGDTLGSAAALCLGLRSLGKTAYVLPNPDVTERFGWLVENLLAEPAGDATFVSVDVASESMVPDCWKGLLGSIALRIDHHGSAQSFTDSELVVPDSASCAELVWDVLDFMGVKPNQAIMDAVYVGLSADTGCFRFANVRPHTFAVAACCAEHGARIFELNQDLFLTNSLAKLKMQAWIVENMKLLAGGTVAVCAIPLQVEEALGVTSDDMDNVASFPRSIAGVKAAATIRETKDGKVKLSVRAVPGYDAAKVCERFGGGGHKGAAGGIVKLPFAEAASAVEQAMLEICG